MLKLSKKYIAESESMLLVISSLCVQLVSVLSAVLIVNYLPLYSYGEYSFYVVIANLFGQYGSLKIEMAIIKEDEFEKEVLLACAMIYVLISLSLFAIICMYNMIITIKYINIYYLCISIVAGFFIMISQYYFLQQGKRGDAKLIVFSRFIQAIFYLTSLFIFRKQLTLQLCMIIFVLTNAFSIFPYLFLCIKNGGRRIVMVLKDHSYVIKYGMANSAVDSVEQFLFPIMVASFLGYQGFGLFRLGYVAMRSGVALVAAAVTTPLVSVLRQRSRKAIEMENFFVFSLLAIVFACGVLCLMLYRVSYLAEYKEGVLYFASLLPWMFGVMLVSPLSLVPVLYGLQRKQLFLSVGYSCLLFSSFLFALLFIKSNWVIIPSFLLMIYLLFCYCWYRKVIINEFSRTV